MIAIERKVIANEHGKVEIEIGEQFQKKVLRVIILVEEDDEITDKEWLQEASKNPDFAFLLQEEEAIYTIKDGKPFKP